MSISRQKSADEVLSRPRAYTAADETAAAARLSAIYTEPDSVTIRQGRRSQESDGTMYYNTNSIISTSTDIYTMSGTCPSHANHNFSTLTTDPRVSNYKTESNK